jgi:hypothetical protein
VALGFLVAAVSLAGCGGGSSESGATVDGQSVDSAKPCTSYIGKTLTVADKSIICVDDGVIEPAGVTVCTNGETYVTLGGHVGGLVGKTAQAVQPTTPLNRETCKTGEPGQ